MMEKFEIVRGNDELAYFLSLGDKSKYREIYIGVRLMDNCCPMCNWFFLSFAKDVKPKLDRHKRFHLLREHFQYHIQTEYEEEGEIMKNIVYALLDCLVVYETATNRNRFELGNLKGNNKDTANRMDKKHHAVYRLIKEFGIPNILVSRLLNKSEPVIGTMSYKGMLIATGGEIPNWFTSALNKE